MISDGSNKKLERLLLVFYKEITEITEKVPLYIYIRLKKNFAHQLCITPLVVI